MRKAPFILAALVLAACTAEKVPVSGPEAPVSGIITPSPDPWNLTDQLSLLKPGEPVPSTLKAGFEGTRTHLEVNSSGTAASVVWDAGDSFIQFVLDIANKVAYSATYTTDAGGPSAEFSSPNTLNVFDWCYSVYPSINRYGSNSSGTPLVGLSLPVNQEAVPGGLARGINLAYASSQVQSGDLTFHNIPSLIRFRISGSIAGSVKNVTVKGQSTMAGDFVMQCQDGDLAFTTMRFSGDVSSNSVVLSGDFVPGQDYFIAVLPCSQRISMVFDDGNGNTITKNSTSRLDLLSGRILDFGTIDLGDSFNDIPPTQPVLYMKATKGSRPVTIAIVPDGFREPEMPDYDNLAREAADAIFSVEPFKSYKDYFNVWIMYAASNESGASVTDGNGNVTEAHDTFFGSKWGTDNYDDMSADAGTVFGFVESMCPDIQNGLHTIQEVPVLMIINDSRYGGLCWNYSNGQAYCLAPYCNKGNPLGWGFPDYVAVSDSDPSAGVRAVTDSERAALGNSIGNWLNIVVHEFCGHGFAHLGDEYWYGTDAMAAVSSIAGHSYAVPFSLNISATYSNTPWQELLDIKSDLVSINPLYERIGVYQGGANSIINRWRSEVISCMIDNRLYFSTWQRVLIVRRIMELAGETFSFASFIDNDVPFDPLRDASSSPAPGLRFAGPVRVYPMTPPPVFVQVD